MRWLKVRDSKAKKVRAKVRRVAKVRSAKGKVGLDEALSHVNESRRGFLKNLLLGSAAMAALHETTARRTL
jgi:hypothetical protein